MNQELDYLTHSEDETIRVAKDFAKTLKPGTVICLSGNLGAGKTTFIKGLALGLGLKDQDDVKSPTFAIMHIYETKTPLYHFDLYRLETAKEIANIGFEEYVNDPAIITCVEWAERAKELLPDKTVSIELEVAGPADRRIKIRP